MSPIANSNTPAAADRVQHRLFDEPNGPESTGVCRVCGKRQEFRNWLPNTDFLTNPEQRLAA